MRIHSLVRTLTLLTTLLVASSSIAAQRESEFMTEFRKLMSIHASAEDMGKLIRKHEAEAILAAVEICQAIGDGSNDVLEEEVNALSGAWSKAYGTNFVDNLYNYFSIDLKGPFKKLRTELIGRYGTQWPEFDKAAKAKDVGRLTTLGFEFKSMGNQFSEVGDHYMASQCYRIYALCFEDSLNGPKADLHLAWEGWTQHIASREKVELLDKAHAEAKVRVETLEFDGFGQPAEEAGEAAVKEVAGAAAPVPMGATFRLVPDIESIQRPNFMADSNFQMWPSVPLGGVGTSSNFPTFEGGPTVLRTGANKALVDLDADGKGDVDIPLTGKIQAVELTLGAGAEQRKWGFLACIGQQRDMYQGFAFNLGPDENQMGLYFQNAGSLTGLVNGVPVQVFDDNLDGIYGSAPREWGYVGLVEGSMQRDVDSVLIGEGKVARPWSRLQKVGEAWFKFESNESHTDIVTLPMEVETGTLQLDLKGPPVSWLIVRGTGNNNDLFFDVAAGGANKVEVPVGSYELYVGQVASGKKQQMIKSLILPGPTSRSWRVEKGGTVKLELGAPFGFSFKVAQDEKTLTVDGKSICVVGRAGETYQRMWNCVLNPEVNVRKAGSKKGKKEAKLVPVGSQEELQDNNNDYGYAWFPIGKPIEKPGEGEFEAQLFEKGHKLFGKIESDWKAN